MENMAAAIDALGSYDVELTRKALSFLVRGGFDSAVKYIMPLTVHPDVAIRFFAKKAIRLIRSRQGRAPSQVSVEQTVSSETQSENVENLSLKTSASSDSSSVDSGFADSASKGSSSSEGAASPSSSHQSRPSSIRSHHSIPRYRRAFVVI